MLGSLNVRSLLLADSFALSFLKFTKSCKNASKNEIYLPGAGCTKCG